MTAEGWLAVDRYLTDLLIGEDPAIDAALAANAAAGLPAIDVSPNQGKLLQLIAEVARPWAPAPSSSWARSAATAQSGLRGRSRRTAT